ncbi:NACHT, LRR and PYD domains-containing protein 3-like [Brachyhypopomus gauderio]|uniref:NACHT, LRR and PYD domains-containing protein 3-like n=1 Tax=Brachyhypopomus gauderio TaxID=698409 RepID=UPI00404193D6
MKLNHEANLSIRKPKEKTKEGRGTQKNTRQWEQRAASPVSSCVCVKRNNSMMEPHNSSSGGGTSDPKVKTAASSVFSRVSKSWFRKKPPDISSGAVTSDPKTEPQKAASPVPSCVSMKSESYAVPSCVSMKSESSAVPSCVSMKSESSAVPSCVSMKSESSPLPSCVSMKSESSPLPSCVSMKSDWSMGGTPNFSSGPVTSDPHTQKKPAKISIDKLESVFEELEHKIISVVKNELKRFKNLLSPDYPACTERQVEDEEDQSSVREGVMKITLHVLRNMNQTDLANTLETKLVAACHRKLKSKLWEKCQKINEGISQHGTTALLNEIYTELYITEGGSGEVNNEHEVRQIETASRRPATQETPIKCSDIFTPLPGQDKAIRTVLTKGVAGIGKTVSVQKFILDWSEGNVNQDVLFIFPLPFRELNLMKEKKLSLVQLLHCFFTETHELKPTDYTQYKILFIFDGLDECRLPLDFQNNESLWDVRDSTSVDLLLTNLIKGNLLPSALLWITSRPAAANQIPPECVDQVTEVRGFSGPQKEEYFRKRIRDQSLSDRIISHMKSSRSLYIMCHIPVFCWISATVLERMLGEAESGEIPKTLTQMFTHFLIFHIKHKDQKYDQKSDTDPQQTRKHVLELGKLAFQQLEKGNLIFYEYELRNSGIDVREMSVYSGMCTQIFREEFGLQLGKVFSFVHLSVQEFLAALYVFITFISTNNNLLEQQQPGFFSIFKKSISSLLISAVDKTLQSQNGHLDLFLRFLLGLSLESNQTLLRGLLTQSERGSHSKEETVKYIKEKIRENPSPEKTINLFHCLNELNDHSLVQEVQTYLSRGGDTRLRRARLSPAQWSAVVFVLLNSEEELDEFDLNKYYPSEECLLKVETYLLFAHAFALSGCGLTEKSCKFLTSVLQTENSLRVMEINNNDLQDSGVEQLCAGLKSSNCKLEILRLSGCLVTEEGSSSLASALSSNSSHLKELDLTYNHPGDSGVKLLSARLEDPHCRLDTLRVDYAGKIRLKPGLRKYVCELTLDPNTAHTHLSLSEGNRKVTCVKKQQTYPGHPERFDGRYQVMCRESLTGRCYWEVECSGDAGIAVTYKGISRKGGSDCEFGWNIKSWLLRCYNNRYSVWHNNNYTHISAPSSSNRVGVYLDWLAGTLSFYSVSSHTHTLTHLHTFHSTFTEPLYAGFWVYSDSSVCVCELE